MNGQKSTSYSQIYIRIIHRSDITFCECILLKNERIIVPTTLRAEMKSLIHQGHLGIENCKNRARQSLFWPLMKSEIKDITPTCLNFRNRQPSEPIINHPIPSRQLHVQS